MAIRKLPVPGNVASAKTRLLFLQHSSVCDQYGGVEYYLHDLVNLAMAEAGYENVRSLIELRSPETKPFPYQTEFVRLSDHPLLRKIENRFSLRYLARARRQIREFRPDLLICSHVSLGPLAYWLHQKYKIPFLTCVYGIDAWGDLWPQDEWSLRRATGIISISHWTKKILVDRGYAAEKIQIVQPRLPPAFENIAPVTREEKEVLTLLTVSRLDTKEQYKGQDHVLAALAEIRRSSPQIKFRYIIQGEGSDKPRLENLVKALDLTSVVEFRGKLRDREELTALYRAADVYVMPSRFGRWDGAWRGEGFGIVYLEAAAFGLPSIAYDCGGATDIIRNGENGILVEPDNVLKLADNLKHLWQNRPFLRQLGERAKTDIEGRFREAAIARQWADCLEVYRSTFPDSGPE